MKSKISYLKKALYIILPLVLIIVVVVRLKNNKETASQNVFQTDPGQAIHVKADTLQSESITAEFSYSGTFEPNKETKMSAEIQGKINEIYVDAGSSVAKGQALIQLDNSLLKLQLAAVELQLEGLEADVRRYTILSQADAIQGIQLEKSILGLKTTQVQKSTLLEQINKTTLRAPFNGIVTAKLSEEGAFAAPGVPLLQITDISVLKFTINIPEHELNQFTINQQCSVTADAHRDVKFTGVVTMIGSKANTGNSFPVQLLVNNTADLKIKSGMFGNVSVNFGETKNQSPQKGIVISTSVISGTSDRPQVYIIRNNKATLQNISITRKFMNKAVISEGLTAGDVIVTSGFINLYDGANVITK